jgi:hypothetical protein
MNVAQHLLNCNRDDANEIYLEIALQSGKVVNEPWSEFLYRVRRLFIHLSAPWTVVDVSRSEEGVLDFLLISENIKNFEAAPPDSFFPSVRDMNQLWMCLETMARAVEESLIDRFSKL